jgi:hypothetical protein
LTRALPKALQSALPTVEEIEAELGETLKRIGRKATSKRPRRTKKGGGR